MAIFSSTFSIIALFSGFGPRYKSAFIVTNNFSQIKKISTAFLPSALFSSSILFTYFHHLFVLYWLKIYFCSLLFICIIVVVKLTSVANKVSSLSCIGSSFSVFVFTSQDNTLDIILFLLDLYQILKLNRYKNCKAYVNCRFMRIVNIVKTIECYLIISIIAKWFIWMMTFCLDDSIK